MKIRFEKIRPDEQQEIVIRSQEMNNEIHNLIKYFEYSAQVIVAYDTQNTIFRIPVTDILYIESIDNHTFLYCKEFVYETRSKLYELEAELAGSIFFRSSKAMILNRKKIKSVSPEFSGRFRAVLENGETVMISRKYVPVMKKMFGV